MNQPGHHICTSITVSDIQFHDAGSKTNNYYTHYTYNTSCNTSPWLYANR